MKHEMLNCNSFGCRTTVIQEVSDEPLPEGLMTMIRDNDRTQSDPRQSVGGKNTDFRELPNFMPV
jgi:hypothetical protein